MKKNKLSIGNIPANTYVLIKLEHWNNVEIALVSSECINIGCQLHGDDVETEQKLIKYKPNSGRLSSSYFLKHSLVPQILEVLT